MVGTRTSSVVARREGFGLLSADGGGGLTLLSAPPGGGKTVLLRSWIEDAGLRDRVGWVPVDREERDAQRFGRSVVGELRGVIGAGGFVKKLEPTPTFDGHALIERLVSELGSLEEPVALVIDDLHEPRSADALRKLELLEGARDMLDGAGVELSSEDVTRLHDGEQHL
jgi:LuxR family transcriptional regulator, maltose regulon positive regulatory protein